MTPSEISQFLLGKAPVLAWAKDLEGRYLYVNDAWLNITNLTLHQVIGRTDYELFEPKYAEVFVENDLEVVRTGNAMHAEERAPFEGGLVGHSTKFPLRNEDGQLFAVGGIAVDITARYLVEKRLEASERKFRELIEHSPEAFFLFDVNNARFVDTNANTERLFGLSREALLKASPAQLSPPLQPDGRSSERAAQQYIRETLKGDTAVFDWVHQAGNGELLPCRIWLAKVELPTGPGVRASILDMREIERVRSMLENTRAQLDAVQDALPQMIVVYDPERNVMSHCNRTYEQTKLHVPLWKLAREACEKCEILDVARQEVRTQGPGPGELILEVSVSVFARNEDGKPKRLLLVATDVTEQRQKDALLRDTQRLESLGRLAGGVAHDFNNLLTVILGAAELLEGAVAHQPDARLDLEALAGAAHRARDLTSQLLTFARSHREPDETAQLDARITESRELLSRLAGEDIELLVELRAPRANVAMNRGQLEQILVNLVANARDAMGSRGRITIETREAELDELSGLSPSALREFVELCISDTGSGMTEETLKRAIDPFFTTKEVGRGTGLGLSTVHGIVTQAGGELRFHSELGKGTRVHVYLPAADKGMSRKKSTHPVALNIHARVLLVEDEDSVRKVNARGLEKAGHVVIEAEDAEKAHALLQSGTDVDVVVTDVVMPVMSGFELADRVHQFLPELPFIFVSGYAEEALKDRGLSRAQVDLLQKPFAPGVLADHVALAVTRKRTKLPPPSAAPSPR